MVKVSCAIDTSAAISLGLTGKFQLAAEFFSFISTNKVNQELVEMSEQDDILGETASDVLKSSLIKFITLESSLQGNKGEIEVVNLANKLKADLVLMDDIKAIKKLQKLCNSPIRFSIFVIFILCEKNSLTFKEGWWAIDNMKIKREWKDNLVIEAAKTLFENKK